MRFLSFILVQLFFASTVFSSPKETLTHLGDGRYMKVLKVDQDYSSKTSFKTVELSCEPGDQLLSGGCVALGGSPQLSTNSPMVDSEGVVSWRCKAFHSGSSVPGVEVRAICKQIDF